MSQPVEGSVYRLSFLFEEKLARLAQIFNITKEATLEMAVNRLADEHLPGNATTAKDTLPMTYEQLERIGLLRTLERTRGDLSAAAKSLSLSMPELRHKLKMHGLAS